MTLDRTGCCAHVLPECAPFAEQPTNFPVPPRSIRLLLYHASFNWYNLDQSMLFKIPQFMPNGTVGFFSPVIQATHPSPPLGGSTGRKTCRLSEVEQIKIEGGIYRAPHLLKRIFSAWNPGTTPFSSIAYLYKEVAESERAKVARYLGKTSSRTDLH